MTRKLKSLERWPSRLATTAGSFVAAAGDDHNPRLDQDRPDRIGRMKRKDGDVGPQIIFRIELTEGSGSGGGL